MSVRPRKPVKTTISKESGLRYDPAPDHHREGDHGE